MKVTLNKLYPCLHICRKAQGIREHNAAVKLQSFYKIRKCYLELRKTALCIQCIFRGKKGNVKSKSHYSHNK